jgi:hypothetical protein
LLKETVHAETDASNLELGGCVISNGGKQKVDSSVRWQNVIN